MPPKPPDDAVVLITGATTGLGLALARRLLDRTNYRLALSARRSSIPRFSELGIPESERVAHIPLDVTDDAQRRGAVAAIEQRFKNVDILVNNAGVAFRSVVEHVTEEERLIQMSINFRSPMELTRLVLPGMRNQRLGRIVNISSVGGMMAMPTMAVYSASKFALEGASEALWYEVRPWNIAVTLVEPGFIRSEGFMNTRFTRQSASSAERIEAAYHNHYEHMSSFIDKLMARTLATPESIAKRIDRVLHQRRPPLRVQATLDARLFSLLRRLLPQRLYHEVLYRSLPGIKTWGKG